MDDKITIEQLIDLFNEKLTSSNNRLEEFKAKAFEYAQLYQEEKQEATSYRRAYNEISPLINNKTDIFDEDGCLIGVLLGECPNLHDILETYRERDELKKEIKELKKAFS